MREYCIRYIPMPWNARGVTVEDGNGFFNIYINSRLSTEMQQEAIAHELRHIQRNDFDNKKSLQDAETM